MVILILIIILLPELSRVRKRVNLMGKDGAQGLLQLKNIGADTIAQTEETCSVYGMPKEAVKLNAALLILSPDEIRKKLEEKIGAA